MTQWTTLKLLLGPLLGVAAGVAMAVAGFEPPICWTAAITLWTGLWWMTEPIPIAATSLIPLAAFPIAGVITPEQVAGAYGHRLILLMMGGFFLSAAMEKSGAHRRIALGMVHAVGGKGGRRVVLGFMLASAALSMWISNTATTLMLLPVALAVLEKSKDKQLAAPLLLGIAFAANVGGIGTPVGTPPNIVFLGQYAKLAKDHPEFGLQPWSFAGWMKIGIPIVLLFVPVVWLWLTRNLRSDEELDIPSPGAWRKEEVRVLTVFVITALLWITRTQPYGGWAGLLEEQFEGFKTLAHDSSVALAMTVALFVIPSGKKGVDDRLLDWPTANTIPWGLLILFGGGIAIGTAFSESGLSEVIGQLLGRVTTLPLLLTIAMICLAVTFMTEIISNTATANILMPILGATATATFDPAQLMVPAAISASCAFMLPVATAPNAVIFGANRFDIRHMMREGFALNLIGAMIITVVCHALMG